MTDWQGFENFIVATNDLLHARGVCYVRKRSNPLKIIGTLPNGQFRAVQTKSESLDFEGTLSGGRAIYFDAKLTQHKHRFSFSHIGDEQFEYAKTHAQFAAVVFFLVRSLHTGRDYLFPVDRAGKIADVWHKRADASKTNARESINWSDARRWRLAPSESWYDALRRLYRG